jgi:MoxR-like ATPase
MCLFMDATHSQAANATSARAALLAAEAQINQIIVGKPEVVRLVLAALLANGHVLLEDLPGVGKTTLAHALAQSFALKFQRVQFTSDLLPADLTGVSIYRRDQERFEFVQGPLFTELLLADELNRGSPKTQSALLEAMAESQITVDGQTRQLEQPFFVIATQNPTEQAGTFVLPESQLDRFMLTLSMGYPDPAHERMLLAGAERRAMVQALKPCVSKAELMLLRVGLTQIQTSGTLLDYVQRLIAATRQSPEVRFGLSPRAGLALLHCARAVAFLNGRGFVLPEDVQQVFVAVAAHRLSVKDAGNNARSVAGMILKQTAAI